MKLGEYLRSAREKQKLSYADVSKIIKIKESFLVALEEENFSEMPPEPFITGFIKSYANFLDLNTQEAIDLYKNSSDIERRITMPKIKTNKAAKKRYSYTATGKIKRTKSNRRHLLANKTSRQRKSGKMQDAYADKTCKAGIKKLLPYGN